MKDCIFCSIARDPSKLIWENDVAAAFKDLYPKAPVHILVVPKQHIESLDQLDDPELAGALLMAVREVAHQAGLKGRFRVALNTGRPAGQVVDHLHFHVLGQKRQDDSFDTPGAAHDQANGLL
jgi:histidine triad (HIT) family protein